MPGGGCEHLGNLPLNQQQGEPMRHATCDMRHGEPRVDEVSSGLVGLAITYALQLTDTLNQAGKNQRWNAKKHIYIYILKVFYILIFITLKHYWTLIYLYNWLLFYGLRWTERVPIARHRWCLWNGFRSTSQTRRRSSPWRDGESWSHVMQFPPALQFHLIHLDTLRFKKYILMN